MADASTSTLPIIESATDNLGPPQNQHALMSAAMLDAKRARMKVEADRQALANRIARLQAEELRATKRIEQTHMRTQEILAAKNRHHQQITDKERSRMEQDAVVQEHREKMSKFREERRQAVAASKEAAARNKASLGKNNKHEAHRNAEAIAHARAADLNLAMFKRNEVRKVEADARERKLREKELMIAHLQQRGTERESEEQRMCQVYDHELSELEKQEYELLVLLEGHRTERQEVYKSLENQLGTAPRHRAMQLPMGGGGGGSSSAPDGGADDAMGDVDGQGSAGQASMA